MRLQDSPFQIHAFLIYFDPTMKRLIDNSKSWKYELFIYLFIIHTSIYMKGKMMYTSTILHNLKWIYMV